MDLITLEVGSRGFCRLRDSVGASQKELSELLRSISQEGLSRFGCSVNMNKLCTLSLIITSGLYHHLICTCLTVNDSTSILIYLTSVLCLICFESSKLVRHTKVQGVALLEMQQGMRMRPFRDTIVQ